MSETSPPSNKTRRLLVVAAVLLLAPIGYSVVAAFFTHDSDEAQMFLEPAYDPENLGCVRDTTYMRLHHWELLTVNREKVVRYGNRDVELLQDCQRCHQSRARFCDRCHHAVNLYPECWGCHYYP